MKFIADFHIHSHFSIATSKQLDPEHLDYWARRKGIKVVGTGDFTHPGWLAELKEKLEPAEEGLFRLKDNLRIEDSLAPNINSENEPRFILTAEVSSIYKKTGRTRKVHNVIFAPDFATVERIQESLDRIGNITSDGRPILGLDSRDLLEIALEADERIFFLPAHIWTPWFSALGAKSGFDTIAECYDDLTHHITAVETGLSSDPAMNWMCSFLDGYTLLSNSDAHSPEKLGREGNLFDTDVSYPAIIDAIREGVAPRFLGTVEFFPQEGKYHYDGHRKCGTCLNPVETLQQNGQCPNCGKPVTVGVMNRIVQLSDREHIEDRDRRAPYHSVIPLKEILSEIVGVGPNSKKVQQAYNAILQKAGTEFNILLHDDLNRIQNFGGELLAEGVRRMRDRQVRVQEGFDGEFGRIHVFGENEIKSLGAQDALFQNRSGGEPPKPRALLAFDLEEYRRLAARSTNKIEDGSPADNQKSGDMLDKLNPDQQAAVMHHSGPALIIAGPGTGKTSVLTRRIAHLIKQGVPADQILAVTFTNKAADEMRFRLRDLLKDEQAIDSVTVSTFHAWGYRILREHADRLGRTPDFHIIDREDRDRILTRELEVDRARLKSVSEAVSQAKQNFMRLEDIHDEDLRSTLPALESFYRKNNLFDLDDLMVRPVHLIEEDAGILNHYRRQIQWMLVDEYQDVNLAQYRLIRLLMPKPDANLCVIGDPNQAIYGFRGADVRYIQQFQKDYQAAVEFRLKQSYRCSNQILRASGGIVEDEAEIGFLDGLRDGVKIHIAQHATDRSEAEAVARTIERMMGGLRFFSMDSGITEGRGEDPLQSLSDVAVLCRTGRQMQAVEKAFHDHSIPVQTVGDRPFFKRDPARSLIVLLKHHLHPENDYLKSTLHKPVSLSPLSSGESIRSALETLVPYLDEKKDHSADIRRLLDMAEGFEKDFEGFLHFAALGAGADDFRMGLENVSLMTLHASKGLEFRCVFIIGCEDGLIPYALFDTQADPNEEKRLLYVGMTRAKEFLFLSYAKKRFLHGRELTLPRSPFLNRISEELVEREKSEYKRKDKPESPQLGLF